VALEGEESTTFRCPGIAESDPTPTLETSLLSGGRRTGGEDGVMVAKAENADSPAEGLRGPLL
jgi:hypothetical protein